MTILRPATRNGVKGHMVKFSGGSRFVPGDYLGTDPRTKAKRRKNW